MERTREKVKAIKFRCGECDRSIRVAAKLAGRRGTCPSCRAVVRVPGERSARPRRRERRPEEAAPAPQVAFELTVQQKLLVFASATLAVWLAGLLWPTRIGVTAGTFIGFGAPVLGILMINAVEAALDKTRIPLWLTGLSLVGGVVLFLFGVVFLKAAANATGVAAAIMGFPLALGVLAFMVGVAGVLSNAVAISRMVGMGTASRTT